MSLAAEEDSLAVPLPLADQHKPAQSSAAVGLAFGLAAHLWWGFVPIYFKLIRHVPPLTILSHRVVWSVLLLSGLVIVQRRGRELKQAFFNPKLLLVLVASSILIAGNWLTFIWAVSVGHLLEASLGYFINPLVNVLLGVTFLKERLRRGQTIGLLLAIAGVGIMTAKVGGVPWVSLGVALTFGFYALLRKKAPVGPIVGLSVETAILLPVALLVIATQWTPIKPAPTPDGAWVKYTAWLLPLSGLVTALPLLWFAAAASRLRLATLGFLQYVGPTCQLCLAVWLYKEPFTRTHAWTFSLIWLALVVYSVDSMRGMVQRRNEEENAKARSREETAKD